MLLIQRMQTLRHTYCACDCNVILTDSGPSSRSSLLRLRVMSRTFDEKLLGEEDREGSCCWVAPTSIDAKSVARVDVLGGADHSPAPLLPPPLVVLWPEVSFACRRCALESASLPVLLLASVLSEALLAAPIVADPITTATTGTVFASAAASGTVDSGSGAVFIDPKTGFAKEKLDGTNSKSLLLSDLP